MTTILSQDQVLSGLAAALKAVDRYAPESVRAAAAAAITSLATKPAAVEALALVGSVGLARMQAAWDAHGPFAAPDVPELTTTEQALARIEGRLDARIDARDAELAAFSALTSALLEIGIEGAKAALPWILATVRASAYE